MFCQNGRMCARAWQAADCEGGMAKAFVSKSPDIGGIRRRRERVTDCEVGRLSELGFGLDFPGCRLDAGSLGNRRARGT